METLRLTEHKEDLTGYPQIKQLNKLSTKTKKDQVLFQLL